MAKESTVVTFFPPQENWIYESFTLLRLFYLLVLFDFFTSSVNILYSLWLRPVGYVGYPKSLIFFSWLPLDLNISTLLALGAIFTTATFLRPTNFYLRLGNMLTFLLCKGFIFSHTRFAHHYWPMLLALVLLSFCPPLDSKKSWQECSHTFKHLQIALALYYFLPSMWKIVLAVKGGVILNANFGPEVVAGYLLTHGKQSLLALKAIDGGIWSTLLLWGGVSMQFLTGWVVFRPRWHKFWGVLILVFHAVSLLVFSINFFLAGLVFFLFFYFAPQPQDENTTVAHHNIK